MRRTLGVLIGIVLAAQSHATTSDDIDGVTFLYPLEGAPAPLPDPGDVNGSGKVDGRDMILLALAFGADAADPRYLARADFNQDGSIDGEDLAILAANFGTLF